MINTYTINRYDKPIESQFLIINMYIFKLCINSQLRGEHIYLFIYIYI